MAVTLPPSQIAGAYQQANNLKTTPGADEGVNLTLPSFNDFLSGNGATPLPSSSVPTAGVEIPQLVKSSISALRQSEVQAHQAVVGKADPLAVATSFGEAQMAFKTAQTVVSETIKAFKEVLNMTA